MIQRCVLLEKPFRVSALQFQILYHVQQLVILSIDVIELLLQLENCV